jgi:hypothetical protein
MSRGLSSTIPAPHRMKLSMSEDRPEGEEKGSAAAIVKEGTLNKTIDELYGYPA